ncbi:hypothetical protein AGLY_002723 [Aphis glycines]|uniref:Uncharacterized protein n=1 Tax=Aphis glycines TaxID=307491 RepID=A0A6G0U3F7_APHGL|nr:hypothetical protein AGLY_002723 [Aphis glycines]
MKPLLMGHGPFPPKTKKVSRSIVNWIINENVTSPTIGKFLRGTGRPSIQTCVLYKCISGRYFVSSLKNRDEKQNIVHKFEPYVLTQKTEIKKPQCMMLLTIHIIIQPSVFLQAMFLQYMVYDVQILHSSRSMDLEPPPKSPIKKLCLGGSGISCGWNSSPIISGRLWLKHR